MIYFTSDLHLSHHRVIEYCNRPFKNVQIMDETIISNWNSIVKPEDTVYVLGDMFFCNAETAINIMKRLNGKKHIIYGNHDKTIRSSKELQSYFESCSDMKEIYVTDASSPKGKVSVVLCHYAMYAYNKAHHGAIQLFGHSHGSLSNFENSQQLDVGVDSWDFKPITFEQIKRKLKTLPERQVKHH